MISSGVPRKTSLTMLTAKRIVMHRNATAGDTWLVECRHAERGIRQCHWCLWMYPWGRSCIILSVLVIQKGCPSLLDLSSGIYVCRYMYRDSNVSRCRVYSIEDASTFGRIQASSSVVLSPYEMITAHRGTYVLFLGGQLSIPANKFA
jgi:hypothetical protein